VPSRRSCKLVEQAQSCSTGTPSLRERMAKVVGERGDSIYLHLPQGLLHEPAGIKQGGGLRHGRQPGIEEDGHSVTIWH